MAGFGVLTVLVVLGWLQTIHVWLLVRFSVFSLIYSCAGNTCGKLVYLRSIVNYLMGMAD